MSTPLAPPLALRMPLAAPDANTVHWVWRDVRSSPELDLPPVTHDVARLAASSGVCVETVWCAAWTVLLHRLTGQAGFPLRIFRADGRVVDATIELNAAATFTEAVRRVARWLGDDAGSVQMGPSAGAGFRTAMTQASAADGVDLLLEVTGDDDWQGVRIGYREGYIDPQAAVLWAEAIVTLIACAVTRPEAPLSALEILGPREKELLAQFNDTDRHMPDDVCLVHHLVEAQARRQPEAIAVVMGDEALSYAALDARADRLARVLAGCGVGPDAPVALYIDRSFEMVVGLLAVLKAGGAYVPLDPQHPADRTALVLDCVMPTVILTQRALQGALPAGQAIVIALDDAWPPIEEATPVTAQPDNLAYVIFTSGSTGTPKGVAMPHRALVNLLRWQAANPPVQAPQRTLQFAALGFDVAFQEVFATLGVGGVLVLLDEATRRDPQALVDLMRKHQVQRLFLPFIALQKLAEYMVSASEPPLALQDVITAGEQLHVSPAIRHLFSQMAGCRLHNQYGPTESHVVTALTLTGDPASWDAQPTIGAPIDGNRIYILDAHGQMAPLGASGEIYIGGVGVARGYLNRPDLTAERFVPDPFSKTANSLLYRTGDIGRWRLDRQVEYLGRNDHQVKVRGFRVELGDIESALLACSGVREAAALALRDSDGEAYLVAYVSGHGGPPSREALRAHLAAKLPPYMVPGHYVALEALPLSPNGKIDRKALPAPASARPELAEPYVEPVGDLECQVCAAFASAIGVETVGRNDNFFDLGGDSLRVLKVLELLRPTDSDRLSTNLFFQDPTPRGIARRMVADPDAGSAAVRPQHDALQTEPVAIIGMAGRFPGADDVDAFWRNLCEGREGISFFSEAELDASVPQSLKADPAYVRARGVIDNVDMFDAAFFGINPREAAMMDPQQRIFLEICWECMERAGHAPAGSARAVGVFAGMHNATYFQRHLMPQPEKVEEAGDFAVMLGNEKDYIATRVANRLNFTGPAMAINTACSTSLVAIAQAFHALRAGHCDMALAGGVAITCPPRSGYVHQEGAMLSPDGHTRSFDADAQGTVFSDGAAVLLLKRLSDAQADGDVIHAVIRGVAVNNDGAVKASFTAPSIDGQAAVVSTALRHAGVDARSVSYVEAHGTATVMGDPVEVEALTRAFRRQTSDVGFCGLGSVKSNVGHLLMAAGAAGVIKTALSLREGKIPATLHFSRPNPTIDFANTPFQVVDQLTPWTTIAGAPRRAGVSSFGVGGANAHVILEEAPATPASEDVAGPQVLIVSARSETALTAAASRLAAHLETHPGINLGDVAHTLLRGRKAFPQRLAVVADSATAAATALRDASSARRVSGAPAAPAHAPIFMFPGQGAQYAGMGRTLYVHDPVFRDALDACFDAFSGVLAFDLRAQLFDDEPDGLTPTSVNQPATFAIEYALACRLQAFGLTPAAMIGHSVGEFAAAVVAGIMSLADAAKLVGRRGAWMQEMPAGRMLSVRMAAHELVPLLGASVALAAHNGPMSCVAAGPSEAVDALQAKLEANGVATRLLQTSHAFHSGMMAPVVEHFAALARATPLRAPRHRIYSTLTGRLLSDAEATDPDYWARHLRETVQFSPALQRLLEEVDNPLLLELGPRNTLVTLARQHGRVGKAAPAAIPSLGASPDEELIALRLAMGRVWTMGLSVDLAQFDTRSRKRRVELPTYPFERRRHWVDAMSAGAGEGAAPAPDNLSDPHAEHRIGGATTTAASSSPSAPNSEPAMPTRATRRAAFNARLRELFEDISGIDMGEANGATPFIELGLDSLSLTQAALQVKKHFKVNVTFRQLMSESRSFDQLAQVLDETLPPDAPSAMVIPMPQATVALAAPVAAATPAVAPPLPLAGLNNAAPLQHLISQQLQLMQAQLEMISAAASTTVDARDSAPVTTMASAPAAVPGPVIATAEAEDAVAPAMAVSYDVKKAFGAIARIHTTPHREMTSRQRARLDAFIRRYVERTWKSKEFTAANRRHMADPRVVNGYRPVSKEITYQIVVERSKGARVWDIDGNEYVDALNGFGMNMFGWQPDFINDAVRRQIDQGYEIGPQHPLAADVTRRICEMSGMDRAALCNTGSEAVMAAMRIARTSTGRSTVVVFSGSYHGTFDEVLVRAGRNHKGVPAAPGVMSGMFGDIRVLDYGAAEALDYIREHADDLAAVLVEPVQSRRPEFQPRAFLQEVRSITEQSGVCLIFDEVITGFRCHPGGAQAVFGVTADLATYGKVIGGGMPIGAVAGKRSFMDTLDGGDWSYGDDTFPMVGVTYFAGTFVRHPLALAAAKASLDYLHAQGPALQEALTRSVTEMAEELTAHCRSVGAPLEVRSFASLWRVSWLEDHPLQDLLFPMMRSRGVHILDNFPCFLTTAHSAADIAVIKTAFIEAVAELQEAEFLPRNAVAAQVFDAARPPAPHARLGRDRDGQPAWFVPDPAAPGKFAKVVA